MFWAYRMRSKASTSESSFSLVYRTEVVIPTKVISLMLRARDKSQNSEVVKLSLDLLEEKREQALIQIAYYQNQTVKYYSKKVQRREFKPGDLVLQRVFQKPRSMELGSSELIRKPLPCDYDHERRCVETKDSEWTRSCHKLEYTIPLEVLCLKI